MSEETIWLNFDGYWREPNISIMPEQSGVYCIYECTHNKKEHTITLRRLLYVGEGTNVNERIKNHEKWEEWKRHVKKGNVVCISFPPVDSVDLKRVEAALIFKYKPPLNNDYKDSFPFDKTTIITSGKNWNLHNRYSVERTSQ